jgi:peptide/nickel transport system substrate-binding protein
MQSLVRRTLAFGIAGLFVLSACSKSGPGSAGGRNPWTIPHTLRYATAEDINSLNPHLTTQGVVSYMSQMTMAWLIKVDEKNGLVPELATEIPTKANGGISADGRTITYHLRKGVKWSDGVPFDADDVLFSISTIMNKANNETSTQGWELIDKMSAPDKYTVVLHLKTLYAPFVETFFSTAGANPCILPKHLLAKYPNINNIPYNAKPIGIGPFKYDRWDRAQQVIMIANPLYWRGAPKLQKIVFKIIPDRNTVLAQLQSHELDLWYPVPGAYYPQLLGIAGYKVLRQPSFLINHFDFNVKHPRVSDPAVRQALRLALDRKTLIDKIGHGIGILQDEPAPQSATYFDPDIKNVPFDIAAANALLDKAGWKRGADGIRAKNGVVLNLDVASSSGSTDVDHQIELIRGWWKQIGVGINVKRYSSPQMFAQAQSGGVVYGNNWDVVFLAWGLDAIGDYSSIYGCQSIPPNGQNDLRWCNPKAQAAMDAVYRDYDQAGRNRDVRGLFEAFVADAPSIVTSLREDVFAYNSDLKDFHPNGVSPFDNMMEVDI